MLYELAWVYVRLGDSQRALRSLEVLSIADPNSPYMADGTLLRADLMLRTGQFDKALKLYQDARAQFDPCATRSIRFSSRPTIRRSTTTNSRENEYGVEHADTLPQIAVQWAREAEDGPAAFSVIDGVKECRDLLKRARALASTQPRARVSRAQAGEERRRSLLSLVALRLAGAWPRGSTRRNETVSGDMQHVRDERRALQKRLASLPVTEADFATREADAQARWNGVSQKLQQMTLQVDQLQAIVNGLKRAHRGPLPRRRARSLHAQAVRGRAHPERGRHRRPNPR